MGPYAGLRPLGESNAKINAGIGSGTTKAPEPMAEADKLQLDLDPVTADEIDALLKRLPQPIVQKVRELAGPGVDTREDRRA